MKLQEMPHKLKLEESILAGCLFFPELLEDAIANIQPKHFYKTANQIIFSVMLEHYKEKKPGDAANLCLTLQEKDLLVKVGGGGYLSGLLDVPVPANMEYSCGKLKEFAILRKTIEICNKSVNDCFNGKNAKEVIDEVQKGILNIDDFSVDNCISMRELTQQTMDRYDNCMNSNNNHKIKTGIHEFDTLTGGLSGSKLIIIAARPRVGKTSMLLNMAQYIAQRGDMVGIFEIEMDKEDLSDRLISKLTGINTISLQSPQGLTQKNWSDITDAAAIKAEMPILIDDTGGLKIMELKRRCRKMKKAGCKIIFIDQLSKIVGDRRKSKFEEVSGIVEELGHLKKELKMPIVLLAQINREAVKNTAGKPTLETLKSTGQIEEESDIVILLNRPYLYTKIEAEKRLAYFDVAKARGAPERMIELEWDGRTTSFFNKQQAEWRR